MSEGQRASYLLAMILVAWTAGLQCHRWWIDQTNAGFSAICLLLALEACLLLFFIQRHRGWRPVETRSS